MDRSAISLATMLCALWFVVTGAFIAANHLTGLVLPGFMMKAGPFFFAGLITGVVAPVPERRPRIIAAALLALVSAAGWTLFSFASTRAPVDRALLLFALAIPINLLGGAWAYFGMFVGGRLKR